MKKIILFLVLLITIFSFVKITEAKTIPIEISDDLCTGVSEATSPVTASCPINSDTNIVFYGQTNGGVGTLSKSWIIHFLDWWKTQDSSINYIGLDSTDIKKDCDISNFPNLKLYIQPGGDAYKQQRTLGSTGKANILRFIDSNKAYLGICAGFYYAANDYYWQGSFYNWAYLLDRFPTVEGSITDIADYDQNPGYALTEVSNGHQMIYYGGPTRGWRNTPIDHPGENLLIFTSIPGNLPAAIKNGKMLLTSMHAEAYENDGITGLTTEQRIENYKWLANSINNVAGTNFYVPPYNQPQLPQCSDGIDNDWDTLIDYPADPGCTSLSDNDEINLQNQTELFFDNFEDGNLNGWSLYGTGIPWSASTDTSYQGAWSARAKKTGAGSDSFMEASISPSNYSTLTFEYYRKLVGLDAADNFEASYYNNGIWTSVENLASITDTAFVYKSFNIPNTAIKIRFKCECGAVSEMCYIDNVKITGI